MRFLLTIIIILTEATVLSGVIKADETTKYKTDTIEASYSFKSQMVNQLIFKIVNTSDESVWLLFEKDKEKSNNDLILERYFSRKQNGYTLFNMMTDANVQWGNWIFDIDTYFLKIIKPQSTFFVIVSYNDKQSAYDIIDDIRLIPTNELIKIRKCLSAIEPCNMATYLPECISINNPN